MQPRGAHVDMRGLHGPGRLHCGSSWHSWESASLGVETRKGGGLTRNSDRRKGLEAQVKGKNVSLCILAPHPCVVNVVNFVNVVNVHVAKSIPKWSLEKPLSFFAVDFGLLCDRGSRSVLICRRVGKTHRTDGS